MYQTKEMAAILVDQINPLGIELRGKTNQPELYLPRLRVGISHNIFPFVFWIKWIVLRLTKSAFRKKKKEKSNALSKIVHHRNKEKIFSAKI